MKLLLVNYEYPPIGGGAGNATYFLSRALKKLGHDVCVLTAAYKGNKGHSRVDGVDLYRIRSLRKRVDRSNLAEMASFVISTWFASLRIARRHEIEGVIVFFTVPCAPIGWHLKRVFGLPYVISLRGGDVPGLVSELTRMHRILRWPRRVLLRGAEAVIANDQGLAALSEAADPVPVSVIPNGVDSECFRPGSREVSPGEAFRFLFVGRFHNQKNLPFMLDEFSRLKSENAGSFEIDLVGDGPLRRSLDEQAARLGLDVKWHGWQPREKLVELYQSSDCVVNLSHYEGMPNVLLEGMACGLPVVASDVAGNNTLVENGETGILVAPGDGEGFRRALGRLMEDREMARRMGVRGRERVEEGYSWRSVAEAYVRILEKSVGLQECAMNQRTS